MAKIVRFYKKITTIRSKNHYINKVHVGLIVPEQRIATIYEMRR